MLILTKQKKLLFNPKIKYKEKMKTKYLQLFTCLFFTVRFLYAAQNEEMLSKIADNKFESAAKISLINALDSVIFDLERASHVGSRFSFPISISSDDTINALDFSFKYNHSKLSYDSITDLTNYMQPLAFYNPNDSTVRFTSNSFQRYANDTALVMVHFTLLSGQLAASDLYSLKGYLNGIFCTATLTTLITTGILSNEKASTGYTVYPNPATNELTITNINLFEMEEVQLIDAYGQIVESTVIAAPCTTFKWNTSNHESGVYSLKFHSKNAYPPCKIILTK